MRSSSKEGSYLRLVDFVSLNSRPRVIKKRKRRLVSNKEEAGAGWRHCKVTQIYPYVWGTRPHEGADLG